jgi:sialate O-acetylesterase
MKRFFLFPTVLFVSLALQAAPKLPYFFSDNMVLQQFKNVPIWGKAAPNSVVKVFTTWNLTTVKDTADAQGNWKVMLKTYKAGGPFRIIIREKKETVTIKNVFLGEVWVLAGQSNMEMPLQGYRDQPVEGSNEEILNSAGRKIHWFKVHRASTTAPLDTVKPCKWQTAAPENVAELSATGWFFAKMLSSHLNVPIGVIACNYGGSSAEAWMRPEALAGYDDYQIPKEGEQIPNVVKTPTTLYNGMLHPLLGYGIRGVLWYQGESNYTNPKRYEEIFPKMVKDWRKLWEQGEFPFYYAQIAPFDYSMFKDKDYVNSAFLRDAQRKVESVIPNSGMIVLMDTGDSVGIHPMNKRAAGERFGMMALAKTYGIKGISYASPRFREMVVKGSDVTLLFDDAPLGLTSYRKEMKAFEIAGPDSIFQPAKAKIVNGTVVVSSAVVTNPVAVRYAFKDYVQGDLFGCNGLPVSSFRTDNW